MKEPLDKSYIRSIIREEGFHYALNDYSSWDEIEDDRFLELLDQYHLAIDNIKKYLEL